MLIGWDQSQHFRGSSTRAGNFGGYTTYLIYRGIVPTLVSPSRDLNIDFKPALLTCSEHSSLDNHRHSLQKRAVARGTNRLSAKPHLAPFTLYMISLVDEQTYCWEDELVKTTVRAALGRHI
ncbi:hypothetical protein PoB_000377300 [Plakobranchus ocellatus]|uniref:Uncharacterized protein n=1 Tax=Plakobranchus ocellatus TaxID=259542 RepID=A0AAV3Y3W7_9GAST|nr:hypothetical protein PoB_000377300 [Plakobranchus ocellatus]